MGKVIGIGGVFLTSPDKDRLLAWYKDVLGLDLDPSFGTTFPFKPAVEHEDKALSVFSIWDADTDYKKPSTLDVMLNFMVDDLEAVLAHATSAGAEQVDNIVDESYGRFAWIMDPDGRKIELWEPKDPGDGG